MGTADAVPERSLSLSKGLSKGNRPQTPAIDKADDE